MSTPWIAGLEFGLVIGVVLALAGWELYSVRRDRRADAPRADRMRRD